MDFQCKMATLEEELELIEAATKAVVEGLSSDHYKSLWSSHFVQKREEWWIVVRIVEGLTHQDNIKCVYAGVLSKGFPGTAHKEAPFLEILGSIYFHCWLCSILNDFIVIILEDHLGSIAKL